MLQFNPLRVGGLFSRLSSGSNYRFLYRLFFNLIKATINRQLMVISREGETVVVNHIFKLQFSLLEVIFSKSIIAFFVLELSDESIAVFGVLSLAVLMLFFIAPRLLYHLSVFDFHINMSCYVVQSFVGTFLLFGIEVEFEGTDGLAGQLEA